MDPKYRKYFKQLFLFLSIEHDKGSLRYGILSYSDLDSNLNHLKMDLEEQGAETFLQYLINMTSGLVWRL